MISPKMDTEIIPDPTYALTREQEIRNWLFIHLAEALEIKADQIDPDAPFDRYGLDSYAAVNLVGELEDWLKCELSPTSPYDYPTVAKLARYLSESGEERTIS
jgi:acyl carrier protein